jgi:hypothetical protein
VAGECDVVEADAEGVECIVAARSARRGANTESGLPGPKEQETFFFEKDRESEPLDIKETGTNKVGAADGDVTDAGGLQIDRSDSGCGDGAHEEAGAPVPAEHRATFELARARGRPTVLA